MKMKNIYFKIHSEGWIYVIFSSLLTIIFLPFFSYIGLIFTFLTLFIIIFFRDPKRVVPVDDMIISPADGRITYIGESEAPKESNIKNKFLKISIFLNIFNVHVNRIPISGDIIEIKYIPGKFMNATFDKSSDENERNIIKMKDKNNNIIVFVQIAGFIARRIVSDLKIDKVNEKFKRN